MNPNRVPRILFGIVAVIALVAPVAQAEPAAYVERNFSAALSLGFSGAVGGVVGAEVPLNVPLPVDFGVGVELGYRAGFVGGISAKALLLPSLGGNPPIALALGTIARIDPAGLRLGLGPIVSLDFSPLVASAAANVGFGQYGFGLDLSLDLRYYLDPFVLELGATASTTASPGAVNLGLRYLF